MAKSEKLDLNNIPQSNDIVSTVKAVENTIPENAVLLDKGLLPSRGKLYPGNIYVKKLSTLNIKNLSTINEQNANYIFNTIISSCVFGIDAGDICIGDKLWFIYYLRAYTYDDIGYQIKHECENCGSAIVLDYHLKNLKVTYLDKEIPEYIELRNGTKVTIKFPTLASENQTSRLKNNENILENLNKDLLDFAVHINTVNDKKLSLKDAYHFVANMDAMDFSKLVNAMSEFMFTVSPYAEFTCPECGETIIERIPFTPTFFLPKV